MISKEKADELQAHLSDARVKIRFKEDGYDVWWHAVAAWFVVAMFWVFRKVTFGGFDREFDDFVTTFGRYVYFGGSKDGFSLRRVGTYMVLRHELIHVYQMEKYGPVRYALKYLLFPLPVLFTGRSKLEFEAYTQQLLVQTNVRGYVPPDYLKHLIDLFVGPSYAFMYVGRDKLKKKFLERIGEISDGKVTGLWPYKPGAFQDGDQETDVA